MGKSAFWKQKMTHGWSPFHTYGHSFALTFEYSIINVISKVYYLLIFQNNALVMLNMSKFFSTALYLLLFFKNSLVMLNISFQKFFSTVLYLLLFFKNSLVMLDISKNSSVLFYICVSRSSIAIDRK